jgi:formate hydrogenlyase subunit 6/NADH:ubiquinone oxidoreductase subunit I
MKIASMLNDVFASLFKRPFTERYPYTVRPAPPRLRGKLLLEEAKCRGCMLCVRDCPAQAIEIEVADRVAKKYVFRYHVDRCIYCAQCVVSCKEGALSMSSELYHLAQMDRAKFLETYGAAAGEGSCVEEAEPS